MSGRRWRSVTLTIKPIPEEFAAVMRSRGMEVPTGSSPLDPAGLVPYEHRDWHRDYATSRGYFWLPCPLCAQPFGGHEIGDTIPDPTRAPRGGVMICPACTARRNGESQPSSTEETTK